METALRLNYAAGEAYDGYYCYYSCFFRAALGRGTPRPIPKQHTHTLPLLVITEQSNKLHLNAELPVRNNDDQCDLSCDLRAFNVDEYY